MKNDGFRPNSQEKDINFSEVTMTTIQSTLSEWFSDNKRDLPWRSQPTSYFVWISEIILQQTRVSQGYDYFMRFTEKWPTLKDLAQASEEEVLKMWQGLGYYSRARNLHRCAWQVVEQHGGEFPADYDALRRLQGIGDYTAAAIASIAFGLPYAVVDGNVYRVLSRLFDIDTPININEGKKIFAQLADELLDREHPGLHNQAMMEFGALHCLPKNQDCTNCPLQAHCLAFANGTVAQRPVKLDKLKVRTRYFNYLVFRIKSTEELYIHKRTAKDIWINLYDFPLIETTKATDINQLLQNDFFKQFIEGNGYTIGRISRQFTHKLTHQTIIAQFIEIFLEKKPPLYETKDILLTTETDLVKYPVPRLIDQYINLNLKFYGKLK